MKVCYSDEVIVKGEQSIFLAGPTPRDKKYPSWRKEALKYLEELGYEGIVYVPERRDDDSSFDYINQVWWERSGLYNANIVVFWVPRRMDILPGMTTNVEFGYWLAKNSEKVLYGRPIDSEKNRYLDWLYETETGNKPFNDLKSLLKEAVSLSKNISNDIDLADLKIVKVILKKYPEILKLVDVGQFTPEAYGKTSETTTYGNLLFKNIEPDKLKEFNRTILSVLLFYYIKNNQYDKFVEKQKGDILSVETFKRIREFLLKNFDTPEKEELLLYYVVINDIGKSQKVIESLKREGLESIDHDLLLQYLVSHHMLPSLNKFISESQKTLLNVLSFGINVGQFIQGECVSFSFDNVDKLNTFEKNLMMMEALLDIGGVLGHIDNKHGSVTLNEPTVNNLLTGATILNNSPKEEVFDKFLEAKTVDLDVTDNSPELNKFITRICLMMRINKSDDVEAVKDYVYEYLDQYQDLIDEFNITGYDDKEAILLYYAPALLNNARNYFSKNNSANAIGEALSCCLPFLKSVIYIVRSQKGSFGKGIITVMLREAAMIAAEDPHNLNNIQVDIINDNEMVVRKNVKMM